MFHPDFIGVAGLIDVCTLFGIEIQGFSEFDEIFQ
jgi:hypothetical protein